MTLLHIASWYPNPWDGVEGNFVFEQIRVFRKEIPARVVAVQVRSVEGGYPSFRRAKLEGGACGYFLLVPIRQGRVTEWLSALLLSGVLIIERAWRYEMLHFHIAYPLLMHSSLWRWWIKCPILISEHWSAYHYNFNLPESSDALTRMRKIFDHSKAVFAVSTSLLEDIRAFAKTEAINGFVLPNVVHLHGAIGHDAGSEQIDPVLFAVSRWVPIKNPMPMLEGLSKAAEQGSKFKLIIGGYGPMIDAMIAYVESSILRHHTVFTGRLSKSRIAEYLLKSDGFLFSSDYETFSVACAEALGAGVPLIGPHINAIAEYAGPHDWQQVGQRSADGWCAAAKEFMARRSSGQWNRMAIAQRAASRFSEATLREGYTDAMKQVGLRTES